MEIIRIPVGKTQTNCYLLISNTNNQSVIIDPGGDPGKIFDSVKERSAKPIAILATHGDYDQVMASYAVQEKYGIPFYIHEEDKELLRLISSISSLASGEYYEIKPPDNIKNLKDGESFEVGDITMKIWHSSGHTKGSVSLYCKEEKFVFSGDVISKKDSKMKMSMGLSGALKYVASIKRILDLNEQTTVFPGHGNPQLVKELRTDWAMILKY